MLFCFSSCLSARSFWCAVKSKREQLNICDSAAIAVCLAGEIFAYHANKQLRDFVSRNNKLKELGKGVVLILESLWQYSQHPNHIGSSCGGDYSSSQGTWVMAGRLVAHSNRFCLACSYEHAENRTFKAWLQGWSLQVIPEENVNLDTLVQVSIEEKTRTLDSKMVHISILQLWPYITTIQLLSFLWCVGHNKNERNPPSIILL